MSDPTVSQIKHTEGLSSTTLERLRKQRHLVQPWSQASEIGEKQKMLVSESDGIYIYDEQGQPFIDGPGGMWCVNVGHRRAEIAQVMAEQTMQLGYYSPFFSSTPPAVELATRLSEYAPGDLNHCFFTTGGSTAVETALRFAQFYNNAIGRPEKKLILTRDDAYHGSTYLSGAVSGKPRDRQWMDGADDQVEHLSSPNTLRRPQQQSVEQFTDGLIEELQTTIDRLGAQNIAAFIGEPILLDEVVTGFGRLGSMFSAKEHFDIEPDMITFAKGVTSGYFPLGGVVISDRLVNAIKKEGNGDALFAHGYTYSSHPVGAAVAMKNLDILEDEGILEHVKNVAPYFQSQLKTLEDLPLVAQTRGAGLMACVECLADPDSDNPVELDTDVGIRIDDHCQKLGLIVRPIYQMCVMSPPLTINREQIDDMTAILREGICRTMDDLRREGIWSP